MDRRIPRPDYSNAGVNRERRDEARRLAAANSALAAANQALADELRKQREAAEAKLAPPARKDGPVQPKGDRLKIVRALPASGSPVGMKASVVASTTKLQETTVSAYLAGDAKTQGLVERVPDGGYRRTPAGDTAAT